MKLRTECIKYRGMQPVKSVSVNGRPHFQVSKQTLKTLLDCDFKISDISNILKISERTIYHFMTWL